jgi:hypothetical protein
LLSVEIEELEARPSRSALGEAVQLALPVDYHVIVAVRP